MSRQNTFLSTPGVEPGLSRPQRDVLTTRRCGLGFDGSQFTNCKDSAQNIVFLMSLHRSLFETLRRLGRSRGRTQSMRRFLFRDRCVWKNPARPSMCEQRRSKTFALQRARLASELTEKESLRRGRGIVNFAEACGKCRKLS